MNKTKKTERYKAPRAELIIMQPENIICTSTVFPTVTLEEMSETDYTFTF